MVANTKTVLGRLVAVHHDHIARGEPPVRIFCNFERLWHLLTDWFSSFVGQYCMILAQKLFL
jgi:hypothetical protein